MSDCDLLKGKSPDDAVKFCLNDCPLDECQCKGVHSIRRHHGSAAQSAPDVQRVKSQVRECRYCGQPLKAIEWDQRTRLLVCVNFMCPIERNPQGTEKIEARAKSGRRKL